MGTILEDGGGIEEDEETSVSFCMLLCNEGPC